MKIKEKAERIAAKIEAILEILMAKNYGVIVYDDTQIKGLSYMEEEEDNQALEDFADDLGIEIKRRKGYEG